MRLWKVTIQNWIGDSIIALGLGLATISAVLLVSNVLKDLTGNR